MKWPEGKLGTAALLPAKRLEAEAYLRRASKPWSVTQGGEERAGPNFGRQSRMWPQRYLSLYCSESEDGGGLVCGDGGRGDIGNQIELNSVNVIALWAKEYKNQECIPRILLSGCLWISYLSTRLLGCPGFGDSWMERLRIYRRSSREGT